VTTDIFQADEGNTELTVEECLGLIPSITTRAELNEVERLNINTARVWAMRAQVLRRPDLLTDGFARELHRRMFNQAWRWAGRYRTTGRNLGWEVPRLTEGVRNAFDDARDWLQHATYPLSESAVRLHHRLVAIHPWPNGNGRHSRLVADLMVASSGGAELTWGARSNLVSMSAVRDRYIAAIRRADSGDFAPLLEFAQS
jgi:Fic-DOC domain mobile mystery protein B